jgi:hypothetical protein
MGQGNTINVCFKYGIEVLFFKGRKRNHTIVPPPEEKFNESTRMAILRIQG